MAKQARGAATTTTRTARERTANGTGKKRAKAAAAVAAKAAAGAPSAPPPNGPTPEEEAHTLAELIRLDTAQAQINNEKSTLLKRFEKKGGDVKAIKAVKTLLNRDPREAEAHLAALGRYGRNAGIKVTWQSDGQSSVMDILAEGASAAPARQTDGTRDLAAARAHSDGFNSGMKGAAPSDNPHRNKPGSIEYVEWHNGRDEGQISREGGGATAGSVAEPAAAEKLPENPF